MPASPKSPPYIEESLERASYLLALGIKPLSGRWTETRKGRIVFRFEYESTAKLGKAILAYKGSATATALDVFVRAYHLRGQYLKHTATNYPIEPEAADLTRYFNNYTPAYGND